MKKILKKSYFKYFYAAISFVLLPEGVLLLVMQGHCKEHGTAHH